MCCSTCGCLGYCPEQLDEGRRPQFKVIKKRTYMDFKQSADAGCPYCDFTYQSFLLLRFLDDRLEVQLMLYRDGPAELHSLHARGVSDVVEIYPCRSNPKSPMINVAKDVSKIANLSESLEFLKENYYSCWTEHEQCQPPCSRLPRRLVDISGPIFRLVETDRSMKARYITLSYPWGRRGSAMTTRQSYNALRHGFEATAMPKVFQDAAMLAGQLDIHYLWIDTLCIIQDDAIDWDEQAAQMGDIFENSAVTIAASYCLDPYQSLFSERDPVNEEFQLYTPPQSSIRDVVFKARRKISRGFHAKTGRSAEIDHLDTRAWGLQEMVLPTRVLAFTGAELQWTCRTLKACECRHNPHPPSQLLDLPHSHKSEDKAISVSQAWSRVVEDYSSRNLSKSEDKLPALGGLARRFAIITGGKYHAGLWEENIVYDLAWKRDVTRNTTAHSHLAPSYSWVNIPDAVSYRFARHSYSGPRADHLEILEAHYKSVGPDIYGRSLGGSLKIRGYVVEAVLGYSSSDFKGWSLHIHDTTYLENADEKAICEFSIDAPLTAKDVEETICDSSRNADQCDGCRFPLNESVILVALFSIQSRRALYQNFLILRKSQFEASTFTRVGLGSGKLYSESTKHESNRQEHASIEPFQWLSPNRTGNGQSMVNVAVRVLDLR